MIPPDPPPEPQLVPEIPQPQIVRPQESAPFWNYQDFLMFLAFALPFLIIADVIVQALPGTRAYGKAFQGLLAQLLAYALVFGALYFMLHTRYNRPFWQSLGWRFPFRGMTITLFGGPVLAVLLGILAGLLRTPELETFRQMLANRPTLLLFALFGVIVGPLCEELAFRGFLMPLLMRSFGPIVGIVATSLPFGILHGPQYSWSWQVILIITLAGTAFGWVRYKTGSTAASTLMHSAYNLTQFAAFLAQGQ